MPSYPINVTTVAGKGSPLNAVEFDSNLTTLKDAVNDLHDNKLDSSTYTASDVLTKIKTVDGSGSGLDADLLDGFHASQTPAPNTIPVADANGKLNKQWTYNDYETYSRMSVGTSTPASPNHNDLFCNSSTLKLYKYNATSSAWIELDWKTIIKASPEYIAGRLRINSSTNKLEISPNGTNWYECIPAVGSNTVELTTLDNTSFSYKYWIAPGQTVIVKNANHIPIVYTKPSDFFITGDCFPKTNVGIWLVYLSNVSTTSYYSGVYRMDSELNSGIWEYAGFRIGALSTGIYRSYTSFAINFSNDNYVQCTGTYKHYNATYGIYAFSSHQIAPSTAYWIGTSRNSTSGYPLQVFNYMTITRRA